MSRRLPLILLGLFSLCVMLFASLSSSAQAASAHPSGRTVGAVSTPAAGASSDSAPSGCPKGWVCLYANKAGTGSPTNKWYYYGTYNLHGIYGNRMLYNHQTGDGEVSLCNNYNGFSGNWTCTGEFPPGWWQSFNFTPINSIVLYDAPYEPN